MMNVWHYGPYNPFMKTKFVIECQPYHALFVACALSSDIEMTVRKENCKFVLVSPVWLLIHSFDIRGWEQQRESFKEPRTYRRRELQLLPVQPQTALYVPMVAPIASIPS